MCCAAVRAVCFFSVTPLLLADGLQYQRKNKKVRASCAFAWRAAVWGYHGAIYKDQMT